MGTGTPVGAVVWAGSTFVKMMTLGKGWDDLEMGDPMSPLGHFVGALVKAGRLPPIVGSGASIGDLIYNLTKGFYWQEASQETK